MVTLSNIRANDGGELLNGNQFHYTKDEYGRKVLNVTASGQGNGDFMADGTVEMTGNLHMGAHAIMGVKSISDADSGLAIESELSMNNHKITDLDYPASSDDAANKGYVDSKVNAMLPPILPTSEGKVLGVVNGALSWVDKA